VISFAFVAIRVAVCGLKIHLDDAMAVMSWILALPITVLNVLMSNALGKDIWWVPSSEITRMYFLFYVSEIFYGAATVVSSHTPLVRVDVGPSVSSRCS
jgi:hypothetical protein